MTAAALPPEASDELAALVELAVTAQDAAGRVWSLTHDSRMRDRVLAGDYVRLLRATASELERAYITWRRAEGGSWADIGRALGITRQAAQQRVGVGPGWSSS